MIIKGYNASLSLIDWFNPPSEKLPQGDDFRVGPESDWTPRDNTVWDAIWFYVWFFELQAVRTNAFSELNHLLLADPDLIDARTVSGQSALHIAVLTGKVSMIDYLVQKHAGKYWIFLLTYKYAGNIDFVSYFRVCYKLSIIIDTSINFWKFY